MMILKSMLDINDNVGERAKISLDGLVPMRDIQPRWSMDSYVLIGGIDDGHIIIMMMMA